MPSPVAATAPPQPAFAFEVPAPLITRLDDAAARGRTDTATWIGVHPTGTSTEFRDFITAQVGPPPSSATALADDATTVRAAEAARTPANTAAAVWIDTYGITVPWQVGASVADAAAGASLLEHAQQLSSAIGFPIKDTYGRRRPFEADVGVTRLPGAVHTTGPSFPSGHSMSSFAADGVSAAMQPERAAETRRTAQQIAFSRVYAGAHFPSDIVAGAYIGAAAAAFTLARPDSPIPERPPRP